MDFTVGIVYACGVLFTVVQCVTDHSFCYAVFPQHEGKPYCNKPCYAALFGPGGFGHGGTESHKY